MEKRVRRKVLVSKVDGSEGSDVVVVWREVLGKER